MAEELDRWFPRLPAQGPQRRLGIVVGGSLSKGLEVKLDPQTVIEGLAVGRYVVIARRTGRRFFSIINDVALDATNPLIEKTPPDVSDPFVAQVVRGTTTFGRIHVAPMLVLGPDAEEPKPVKTGPGALLRGVRGVAGGCRTGLRAGRATQLLRHRGAAGYGRGARHRQPGAVRGAVGGRLREDGHRQDVPDPSPAGGPHPGPGRRHPDF